MFSTMGYRLRQPRCQVEFSLRLTVLILVVSACCVCVFLFFPRADGETGEDVVCALGEHRAPPGSAGLGQSAVGGHVRSETAHKPARQSGVMAGEGMKTEKRLPDCVCVFCKHGSACWYWKMFVFIFSPRSLHSVCSHYARCFLRLSGQELGNDCTHSCGTQACKSTGCIMFPSRYQLFCS